METEHEDYSLSNGKLMVRRNEATASVLISIFHMVNALENPVHRGSSGAQHELAGGHKDPGKIVKGSGLSDLEDKFYNWKHRLGTPLWFLNRRETALLRQACNTAYYYSIRQEYRFYPSGRKNELAGLFNVFFELKVQVQEHRSRN